LFAACLFSRPPVSERPTSIRRDAALLWPAGYRYFPGEILMSTL
jgi:hypothetical protein